MRQTIHIFRKDVRQLKPYLIATTACLAASVVVDMMSTASRLSQQLSLLHFALVLSWWFTIAAAIQAENPTGDRQFWITRPYSWKSILCAKLLFIVVCIAIPLWIADVLIVAGKGFSPWPILPGILKYEATGCGLFLLPAFVLGGVTRGPRQFMLTLLVALGVTITIDTLWGRSDSSMAALLTPSPVWQVLEAAPIVGLLAAALWHFASRRTNAVRISMLACGALIVAQSVWPTQRMALASVPRMQDAYPDIGVVFAPGPEGVPERLRFTTPDGLVTIAIPITFAGGDAAELEADPANASLQSGGHVLWQGPCWNPSAHLDADPEDRRQWMELGIRRAVLDRIGSQAVDLQAVFGIVIYDRRREVRFRVDDSWHRIPDGRLVRLDCSFGNCLLEFRVPLWGPAGRASFWVQRPDNGVLFRGQRLGLDGSAGISPVNDWVNSLAPVAQMKSWDFMQRKIPSDVEVVVQTQRRIGLVRRDLAIHGIRLRDYVVPVR